MSRGVGRRRRTQAPRDQDETAFTALLTTLLSRIPAALGAALVDRDGETVDYAGAVAPFDVRVAAARWRIVLDESRAQDSLASLRWLCVRAAGRSYVARILPCGYALIVVLESAGAADGWQRAMAACAAALAEEAGWSWAAMATPEWSLVRVEFDNRGRPLSVAPAAPARTSAHGYPVEVLGAVRATRGLARCERAWRVRIANGIEATLTREPGGAWYTDEPIDPTARGPSRETR